MASTEAIDGGAYDVFRSPPPTYAQDNEVGIKDGKTIGNFLRSSWFLESI
jgi:hypothetical protein